jgi:hypothetical protein
MGVNDLSGFDFIQRKEQKRKIFVFLISGVRQNMKSSPSLTSVNTMKAEI